MKAPWQYSWSNCAANTCRALEESVAISAFLEHPRKRTKARALCRRPLPLQMSLSVCRHPARVLRRLLTRVLRRLPARVLGRLPARMLGWPSDRMFGRATGVSVTGRIRCRSIAATAIAWIPAPTAAAWMSAPTAVAWMTAPTAVAWISAQTAAWMTAPTPVAWMPSPTAVAWMTTPIGAGGAGGQQGTGSDQTGAHDVAKSLHFYPSDYRISFTWHRD